MGIPVVHEELTVDLQTMFQQAIGILSTEEQREFHRLQGAAFSRIPEQTAPVETIASIVLESLGSTLGNHAMAHGPILSGVAFMIKVQCTSSCHSGN